MPISLPEGEMSGRTEGGGLALSVSANSSKPHHLCSWPIAPAFIRWPVSAKGQAPNLLPGLATAK
ncbi:hypothetical protein CK218_07535 [Mesorhizobium sp. WSM3879]|nr:hypothetical protein CK218_07535 [Mesorhizobium sp. WSM3879]